MSNEIRKPIVVARGEFYGKLVELINNSELPPYIIEPILSNILGDVQNAVQTQYQDELQKYNAALAEINSDNTESVDAE